MANRNASALITRQQALDYLELSSVTPAQASILDVMINGVTSNIQRFCRRQFRLKAASAMGSYNPVGTPDYAIFFYPLGGQIFLPNYPVATIATLYVPYAVGGTTDSSTITRTDYWLDKNNGIIELSYVDVANDPSWRAQTYPSRSYRAGANYKAGFGTIPGDLQMGAMEMVAMRWRGRRRDGNILSEEVDDSRFTYDLTGRAPAWVEEIFQSYKRVRM